MSAFHAAVVSVPGRRRIARTPFGAEMHIHATAAETGGTVGMWESFTPPGQGPAPHMHTRETEVFRVIRGLYRVRCGDEEFDAPEGAVIVLPPNVWHGWRNIGDVPGQLFGIAAPGGLEQMFIDIAEAGVASQEEVARIEARFGIVNEATLALAAKPA
ncbi:MAG: cupin domain-containing protein [Mesorhizobium sp.]|nr:cupin domain-containing protein [Mesorhizobium sp.]MCO5160033.1 cupin domain-containing protein [Mesorhizobium sp.]